MDLYVMTMVSFCWPQLVPARALRMLRRGVMRVMRLLMCGPKVKWGSRVTPRMRGCLSSGRVLLLRVICGVALDCLLSGVNRVTVDFGAERASPCSSAHCETRVACSERAEAAAV